MPVVSVKLRDFCSLIGLDLGIDDLRDRMPMMGIAWEREYEDGYDVEVFPNRPDMFSVEGLARAYAGFMGVDEGLRKYDVRDGGPTVYVDRSIASVRPYILVALIDCVNLSEYALESVIQLQEKLHISYCRDRRKASIGIHDAGRLEYPLTYKAVRGDELRFKPLDFDEELTPEEVLEKHPKGIAYGHLVRGYGLYPILMDDGGRVLSMPPIINGEYTRVTTATKRLLIDITGLDIDVVSSVMKILVCNICERGGVVYMGESIYEYDTPLGRRVKAPILEPCRMELDIDRACRLIGVDIGIDEALKLLRRMRYDARIIDGKIIEVYIPPYRVDVMHWVDLAEDLLIAFGYDKVEPAIPAIATIGGESPLELFTRKIREVMVGLGFQEVMTYVLSNPRDQFDLMRVERSPCVEIENPKTLEFTMCRLWLLPCLMNVLASNKHNPYPQRIFEADDAAVLDPLSETGARNLRKLAAASAHVEADFAEAKAVAEALIRCLGLQASYKPLIHPSFIEGRAASVEVDSVEVGFLGEVHPEILEKLELENPVAALEVNLESLYHIVRKRSGSIV
ncbi:MAG: phenylalanine--tRNA ligase subunit beta [Candidatus Bathyarchaeia archaeon]